MILQFIGFFVVFGLGCFVTLFVGRELYYYFRYQCTPPFWVEDFIGVFLMLILICMGLGLMYYAGTHAPFTMGLDFNLKV